MKKSEGVPLKENIANEFSQNSPANFETGLSAYKQIKQYLDSCILGTNNTKPYVKFLKRALQSYKTLKNALSPLEEKECFSRLIAIAEFKLTVFLKQPGGILVNELQSMARLIEEFAGVTEDCLSAASCYLFIGNLRCTKDIVSIEDLVIVDELIDFLEAKRLYQKALEKIIPTSSATKNDKDEDNHVNLLLHNAQVGIFSMSFLNLLEININRSTRYYKNVMSQGNNLKEVSLEAFLDKNKISRFVLSLIGESHKLIEAADFIENVYKEYFLIQDPPVEFKKIDIATPKRKLCINLIDNELLVIDKYHGLVVQVLSYYQSNKIIKDNNTYSEEWVNLKKLLLCNNRLLEALKKLYEIYQYIQKKPDNATYLIWQREMEKEIVENNKNLLNLTSAETEAKRNLQERQKNFDSFLEEITNGSEYKLKQRYQKAKLLANPKINNDTFDKKNRAVENESSGGASNGKTELFSPLKKAYSYFMVGKFTEAIDEYEEFLKILPTKSNLNIAALMGMADCYNALAFCLSKEKQTQQTDNYCSELRKKAISTLEDAKQSAETLRKFLEPNYEGYNELKVRVDFIKYDLEKLHALQKKLVRKVFVGAKINPAVNKSTVVKNKNRHVRSSVRNAEKYSPKFFKTNSLVLQRQPKIVDLCTPISNAAKLILSTLKEWGFSHYIVGGFVRDVFLNREPHDCDIVTNAHPEEIIKLFPGISKIIDGGGFPHIVVVIEGESVEVATFSREDHLSRNVDPTKAASFGNMFEDAQCRDLTINAFYYDPYCNKVIDYHGGYEHIKQRVISLIGHPPKRIENDPTRILRIIRLSASLNFTIAPATEEAIRNNSSLLEALRGNVKLYIEVKKLFFRGSSEKTFDLLEKFKLLKMLFPSCADSSDNGSLFRLLLSRELREIDQVSCRDMPMNRALFFAVLLCGPLLKAQQTPYSDISGADKDLTTRIEKILDAQLMIIPIPAPMIICIKSIWMAYFLNDRNFCPDFKTYVLANRFSELINSATAELVNKQSNKTEIDIDKVILANNGFPEKDEEPQSQLQFK